MTTIDKTKETVHSYAGWCGKALCYGDEPTPPLTTSSVRSSNDLCQINAVHRAVAP